MINQPLGSYPPYWSHVLYLFSNHQVLVLVLEDISSIKSNESCPSSDHIHELRPCQSQAATSPFNQDHGASFPARPGVLPSHYHYPLSSKTLLHMHRWQSTHRSIMVIPHVDMNPSEEECSREPDRTRACITSETIILAQILPGTSVAGYDRSKTDPYFVKPLHL